MSKPIDIRNRITALELHKGSDLTPNEFNWRTHSEAQANALAGVLDEIGISGALLAYHSERNGGKLTVIDGHLRSSSWQDAEWPVLVTDLNDAEADYLLTVFDPLGAMAGADYLKLSALAEQFQENEAVMEILTSLELVRPEIPSGDGENSDLPDFKEYDESAADGVEYIECPNCGHKWPK